MRAPRESGSNMPHVSWDPFGLSPAPATSGESELGEFLVTGNLETEPNYDERLFSDFQLPDPTFAGGYAQTGWIYGSPGQAGQFRDIVARDLADIIASALKQAEAQRRSVQAQLREAQSTLSGNEASLGYARIYAPIAGTVVSQTANIRVGLGRDPGGRVGDRADRRPR